MNKRLMKQCLLASFFGLSLISLSIRATADVGLDDTNSMYDSDELQNTPSMIAMAGDLILARPILVGITLVGTGLFVATLPFSAAGGNVREAATVLVKGPAEQAFVRCLGCTATQERWRKEREAKEAQKGIKTDTAVNY